MVLLAAWCGLRFGELAELRRSDLDLKNGRIRIRRAVVRVGGKSVVGTPKSDAGIRDVAIPPHLLPILKAHIGEHAEFGRDGLLFPAAGGGHLAPSSLYKVFYPARKAAGRPDLRWHDLRHTGAVLAAATGATLAELMARLGHSTQGAALRYQHAAQDRDMEIARRLSAMVGDTPGVV
jgi:integrase